MVNVKLEDFGVLKMGLRSLHILVENSASGKLQKFGVIYWGVDHCMIVIKLPTTHTLSPHLASPKLFRISSFDLPATMDPTEENSVGLIP